MRCLKCGAGKEILPLVEELQFLAESKALLMSLIVA
jgi:hypothetical protein